MKKQWISYVLKLCVAFVITVGIMQYVLIPTKVVMSSMYPTLDDGQYVIVNRFPYKMSEPVRGDIVVFSQANSGNTLIKRIIGLPGECVQFRNDRCYINHKLLIEQEDKGDTDYSQAFPQVHDHNDCLRLKENQYYVLGDNRPISLDSRAFGPITKESIIGKMILRTPLGDK